VLVRLKRAPSASRRRYSCGGGVGEGRCGPETWNRVAGAARQRVRWSRSLEGCHGLIIYGETRSESEGGGVGKAKSGSIRSARGFRRSGELTGPVSDAMDQLGIAGAVPGSTLRPTDRAARLVARRSPS